MKQLKWILGIYMVLMLFTVAGCSKKLETEVNSEQQLEQQLLETGESALAGVRDNDDSEVAIDGDADAVFDEEEETSTVEETTVPISFQGIDETVYGTTNVNIRKAPTTSAEIVGLLRKGQSVRRTGWHEEWSRVEYNGQECYIFSAYLSIEEPVVPSAGAVYGSGGGQIVAIDPGHQRYGNSDKEPVGPGASTTKAKVTSGATGVVTGIKEHELTLQVSLKLRDELIRRGYQVVMIRETHDVDISNRERAEIANQSGATSFIRIHGNSIGDSSVHGALTMSPSPSNSYVSNLYNDSYALSKYVLDGMCATTGFRNRGVTLTDEMSGINWCTIPVTIVEMGFMSNPDEDRKMASDEYQDKIVKGIADGIDAYYQNK